MKKVSLSPTNDFCPQTLFVYGTYKKDGSPNFGLFCWFSYCYFDNLGVMAAIGGAKPTLERIRETGVFSANLVTEKTLALADFFGTVSGEEKARVINTVKSERGAKLDVPILSDSPLAFELAVEKTVELEGATVLLCSVQNVLVDEMLASDGLSIEEKLREIAPVRTTCQTYFGWDGTPMGAWHEPCETLAKP